MLQVPGPFPLPEPQLLLSAFVTATGRQRLGLPPPGCCSSHLGARPGKTQEGEGRAQVRLRPAQREKGPRGWGAAPRKLNVSGHDDGERGGFGGPEQSVQLIASRGSGLMARMVVPALGLSKAHDRNSPSLSPTVREGNPVRSPLAPSHRHRERARGGLGEPAGKGAAGSHAHLTHSPWHLLPARSQQ